MTVGPTTPKINFRFGLFPFRSPLLRESRLISFPLPTEMSHFGKCRLVEPMNSVLQWRDITPAGFPHSEIFGSKSLTDSPKLIAGMCVLHRLSMPRHPPAALNNLITYFFSQKNKYLSILSHYIFNILWPLSKIVILPVKKLCFFTLKILWKLFLPFQIAISYLDSTKETEKSWA